MNKSYIYSILATATFLVSCDATDRDDDIINVENPQTGTTTTTTVPTADIEINDYIWEGLNTYYYWQEDVPMLANSIQDDAAGYQTYLESTVDPEDFFENLNHSEDRFSWIVDDYQDLENQLAGISANDGMNFLISRQCDGCNELFGFVTYVLPDSDAASKGIERGDLFTTIGGSTLTVNNYQRLLNSQKMSYTIGLVEYNGNTGSFNLTGETVTLNKVENFQENPIHKNAILLEGDHRIGYLMYNQFVNEFDDQLIEVFSDFASQNVTDLVLDLRYNGGGSVQTCTYLASMITGQFNGEIFAKQIWNSKLLAYFDSLNNNSDDSDDFELNNYFTNSTTDNVPLPSLNLSTVYILTSNRSASASELLINGLAPHINVVQIGSTTYGKNVGSITLYDYIDNNRTKNPNHTYAMQPIVLKIANSVDFADYADGLEPDHEKSERASSMGVLGERSEPLLYTAINLITGTITSKQNYVRGKAIIPVLDPEFEKINGMFIELPQNNKVNFFKN